jgi:hypothetical protein
MNTGISIGPPGAKIVAIPPHVPKATDPQSPAQIAKANAANLNAVDPKAMNQKGIQLVQRTLQASENMIRAQNAIAQINAPNPAAMDRGGLALVDKTHAMSKRMAANYKQVINREPPALKTSA